MSQDSALERERVVEVCYWTPDKSDTYVSSVVVGGGPKPVEGRMSTKSRLGHRKSSSAVSVKAVQCEAAVLIRENDPVWD
jgi:hypothetical protein